MAKDRLNAGKYQKKIRLSLLSGFDVPVFRAALSWVNVVKSLLSQEVPERIIRSPGILKLFDVFLFLFPLQGNLTESAVGVGKEHFV